jgi:hypothetical protein
MRVTVSLTCKCRLNFKYSIPHINSQHKMAVRVYILKNILLFMIGNETLHLVKCVLKQLDYKVNALL